MLVCLTPMRNAAADIEGFLESVTRLADAVIVLDDGSDDTTRDRLQGDARVTRLLCNPVRNDHSGWDDSANRQRLLGAAAEIEPDWVIYLDADERVDEDDAAALTAFLEGDALPGCAYGLQLFSRLGRGGSRRASHLRLSPFRSSPGLAAARRPAPP